jgi:hypothetical protein
MRINDIPEDIEDSIFFPRALEDHESCATYGASRKCIRRAERAQ